MQTLLSLIEQYLDTCEYERKLSPDTIKAYRIDLRQFSEFAGEDWKNGNMLNCYIKFLNQHFAPRSVKRKVASVRTFYHELELRGASGTKPV